MIKKIALGLAATAVAGIAYWYAAVESYRGPPRTAEVVGAMSRPSRVIVPISVSLDELQKQANEKIPARLVSIAEGRDGCVPAQWINAFGIKTKITPDIDCHIEGAVDRGPVSIGGAGRNLVLSSHISAGVTVRGRGDIGQHIRETGDGALDATVGMAVDIAPDWTPQVTVNPGYRWTDAFGITVFGIRITFASKINPKIDEQLQRLKDNLPGIVAQLGLRQKAEEGWKKGFTVVPVSETPPVWVRFTPQEIGFPGYAIEGRFLNAQIAVAGITETFLGPKPPELAPTPLPPLKKDMQPGGFDVFVPVSADYAALADAAKKELNVGQERIVKVDALGDVRVIVNDVTLHQTTGRKLAIGVNLSAKPPQAFLSTKGTVWLIADIAIDNAARRIVVKSLDLYSQTDNAPVDLLASLVRVEALNKAIRDALTYNFGRDYEKALADSSKLLKRELGNGARIDGALKSATVEEVRFGPDGIILGLAATGDVRLVVGSQ